MQEKREIVLENILRNVDQLPSLPIVIGKVLELMRNPRTSMTEIGEVVSEDLALSSKILKIVNSAYYGFSQKISTISRALVILGFNTLKSAILGVSVINTFKNIGGNKNNEVFYRREDFWAHSICVGATARVLAKRTKFMEIEEAFIAGILHDIGKLVLDQFSHDNFIKVMHVVADKDITMWEAEKEVLNITHTDIGYYLVEKWQFPTSLVNSVYYHHNPSKAPMASKTLVSIIHIADIITRSIRIGNGGDNSMPPLNNFAWNFLKLNVYDIEAIMEESYQEFERAAAFLDIAKE